MLSLFLQNHLFSLTILASDKGSPSQSTSVLVYLNVKDVNDNEPQFNHQSYAGQVLENAAVGTVVLTVQATDIDSGKPQRSSLICITHTTMITLRFQRSPMSLSHLDEGMGPRCKNMLLLANDTWYEYLVVYLYSTKLWRPNKWNQQAYLAFGTFLKCFKINLILG